MGWGIGEALTLVSLLATLASAGAKAGGAIEESQEQEKLSQREEEIEEHAEKLKDLRERRARRDQIAKALGTENIIDVGEPDKPKEYKTDVSPGWDIAGGIADVAGSTAAYGAGQVGSSGGSGSTRTTGSSYTQPTYQTDTNVPGIGSSSQYASSRYDPYRVYGGGPLYG